MMDAPGQAVALRPRSRRPVRRPGMGGLMRAELVKLIRSHVTWLVMLVPVLVTVALPAIYAYVVLLGFNQFARNPAHVAYQVLDTSTQFTSWTVGILALVVSARATAEEYQFGTIRILLGRGAGRLRLLAAKLGVLLPAVLVTAAVFAAIDGIIFVFMFRTWAHGIPAMSTTFWQDTALSGLAVAVSLVLCVLLGTAAGAVGRSLAFALPVALCWFPADNVAVFILQGVSAFTHSAAVGQVTAFLLGPTLSDLPAALEPHRRFTQGFVGPLVTVGGTRALLVAGCWGLALLVLSIGATTMREVRE